MTAIEIAAIVGIVLILLPWVVYTSTKLGAYGFLKGRELFHKHEENGNGETKKT